VLLRFLITLDSSGDPASASIEIAPPKKPKKPIGFVRWSPKRSVTYYRAGTCTTQTQ
jgi:hypothetical protein